MAVSDVPLGYLRRTAAENLPPPSSAYRNSGLAARQSALVARECRAYGYLHEPDYLGGATAAALPPDRRRLVGKRSHGLPGHRSESRSRRLLGVRARVVLVFRLWVLSDRAALARRRILCRAGFRHRLAGVAEGAASRSRLDLLFRRAAADLAGVALRLSGHRPRCSADQSMGRGACDHCGRRCRHGRIAADRHFAGVGTAV